MVRTTARRDGDGWVIDGEKWHVTSRRRRRLLPGARARRRRPGEGDRVPRRQGHAGRAAGPHAEVHAHVRVRASDLRVRGRAGGRGRDPRRGRRGVRAHEGLVRRGAADDRRAHRGRVSARALELSRGVRAGTAAVRTADRRRSRRSSSCSPTWRPRSWRRSRCCTACAGRPREAAPTASRPTRMASAVKLVCSETAGRVIDKAVQIFGGRGYMRERTRRAALPRAARRSDLGGHERDPARGDRQRAAQTRLRASTRAGRPRAPNPGTSARRRGAPIAPGERQDRVAQRDRAQQQAHDRRGLRSPTHHGEEGGDDPRGAQRGGQPQDLIAEATVVREFVGVVAQQRRGGPEVEEPEERPEARTGGGADDGDHPEWIRSEGSMAGYDVHTGMQSPGPERRIGRKT